MNSSSSKIDQPEFDPVFLSSRREAIVIFCVWLAALLWAVPICYFNGYLPNIENFDPDNVSTVLGIPTWLFWGIFVPWLAADVFTIWFCFCYMKDDDLGEDPSAPESDGAGKSAKGKESHQ